MEYMNAADANEYTKKQIIKTAKEISIASLPAIHKAVYGKCDKGQFILHDWTDLITDHNHKDETIKLCVKAMEALGYIIHSGRSNYISWR